MHRLPLVLILSAACALATTRPAGAADPHPFTVRDLVAMDRLSEPAVSPDGSRIALTISALDLDANRRRADIWLVDIDGANLRRLTTDPANDTSAVWHRDGQHVYFLSSRGGSSQVWQADVGSGRETQVTRLPLDVNAFKLSADGRSLVVSLDVFVDCDTVACTADRLAAKEKTKASGQTYDRLFVRHWDTWSDGRRAHLFVVPVAGGAAVDVMKGDLQLRVGNSFLW